DLASRFTGTRKKWFTLTNGTHIDSLDPETANRWYDFLELYVAHQAPITESANLQGGAPVVYEVAMGIPGVTLPPDPIQQQPTYPWVSPRARNALAYVPKPLTANTTVVGPGALHVWVRSSARNVDLQATITEVRPDGKETFVQNGWLRGNERKLDSRKSTLL